MSAYDNSRRSDLDFQNILSNVPYVLGSYRPSDSIAIGRKRPGAEVRFLSKTPESNDSALVVHSLDSPATLPVESGLPVRF